MWISLYNRIKERLGLSFYLDQEATDTLSRILSSMPSVVDVEVLREVFAGRCILVFGPANNIDRDFRRAIDEGFADRCAIVAVDGASRYLYEVGVTPDVIVTDLDGDVNSILNLNRLGSVVVVHGHGDNISDIAEWVPRLRGPVLGSTQVEPRPHVYNFGGFTDGDRALFIAYAMGIREAVLGGMDFTGEVGRYSVMSKPKDLEVKRIKMGIAVELISMLVGWGMRVKSLSPTGIPSVEVI